MPDQLTDRARKAAEEIFEYVSEMPAHIPGETAQDIFNRAIEGMAAIFDRHMWEIIIPYQKTIECAAYKLACSVSPQCPGDTGDMSCSDDECERDTDSIAECWVKCFTNMITEEIHKEAAPCPE